MIKILDICSGIGGFSLGLESTGGFDTVAFCEFDDFCRKVLNKHWPDVPIYKDLKEIGNEPERIIQDFDLICGGIPCQPFSVAGKKKGKEDDRHLWPYMYEIIKHKKPTWVIVENVGGFVNVALDDVCLDLEAQGYATQSFIIPACSVEAPHRRDRIWILGKNLENPGRALRQGGSSKERMQMKLDKGMPISLNDQVAHPDLMWPTPASRDWKGGSPGTIKEDKNGKPYREAKNSNTKWGLTLDAAVEYQQKKMFPTPAARDYKDTGGEHGLREASQEEQASRSSQEQDVSHAKELDRDVDDNGHSGQCDGQQRQGLQGELGGASGNRAEDVANSERSDNRDRGNMSDPAIQRRIAKGKQVGLTMAVKDKPGKGDTEPGVGGMADGVSARLDGHYGFEREPNIPRVATGIPDRVNRLKALGNSIVPQVIYNIGLAILEEEERTNVAK